MSHIIILGGDILLNCTILVQYLDIILIYIIMIHIMSWKLQSPTLDCPRITTSGDIPKPSPFHSYIYLFVTLDIIFIIDSFVMYLSLVTLSFKVRTCAYLQLAKKRYFWKIYLFFFIMVLFLQIFTMP